MTTSDMFRDTVMDAIAQILPYAPRDFTVEVSTKSSGTPGKYSASIHVVALTAMGRAIKPVLEQQLKQYMYAANRQQTGTKETRKEQE